MNKERLKSSCILFGILFEPLFFSVFLHWKWIWFLTPIWQSCRTWVENRIRAENSLEEEMISDSLYMSKEQ